MELERKSVKTIESMMYESLENGRCRSIGMRSPEEIFKELKEHLKESDLIPDEYFMCSPVIERDFSKEFLEQVDDVSYFCHVDFGSCEGIHLEIEAFVIMKNGEHMKKFMIAGKTLSNDAQAFRHMGKIGTECSLLLNGQGFCIRDGYKTNEVYYSPYSEVSMTPKELIYALGFDSDKFADKISEEEMLERISGRHCDCAANEGEFNLLPINSEVVMEGEKRYMVCRKCGKMSHL